MRKVHGRGVRAFGSAGRNERLAAAHSVSRFGRLALLSMSHRFPLGGTHPRTFATALPFISPREPACGSLNSSTSLGHRVPALPVPSQSIMTFRFMELLQLWWAFLTCTICLIQR